MKTRIILIICACIAIMQPTLIFAQAKNIYVATNGTDAAGRGTLAAPYLTPQYAVNNCKAGDTIVIRGGTYNLPSSIRLNKNNITMRSYPNEWAILKLPNNSTADGMGEVIYGDVDLDGGTIERLELVGGSFYTINLKTKWEDGGADRSGVKNFTIKNCKIHSSGRDCIKITPGCSNITIESCEIYNSGLRDNENADGIDCVNGSNVTVRNCYIHDIATNGMYLKGGAINGLVESNLVTKCGSSGICLGFKLTDSDFFDTDNNPEMYENINGTVINNIVIDVEDAGIGLFAANNPKVYNNTVINAGKRYFGALYICRGEVWSERLNEQIFPPNNNVDVRNNIFMNLATSNGPVAGLRYEDNDPKTNMTGACTVDYNIYYKQGGATFDADIKNGSTFEQWKTNTGFDAHSQVIDPKLDANYHLTTASTAAIDKAIKIATVLDDYDGDKRPELYDIGADEYIANTALKTPPSEDVIGTGKNGFVIVPITPIITSVTAGSRCGAGTVALSAASNVGTINWYAAASGGTSLGTGKSFTTLSLNQTTTYYVDATYKNTTSARTAVAATIKPVPSITATTPAQRCGAGTVTLTATPSAGSINWYDSNTATVVLSAGNSYSPSVTATRTFYVAATNNGCSSARTAIVATINPGPSITKTTGDQLCGEGTITLSATASAGTINWYAVPTGGTVLASGTSFKTPVIKASTTYYVDATNNGCTSARTAVQAVVNAVPTITKASGNSRCGEGTVTLNATASSGTINWYAVSTGGNPLASGTSFETTVIKITTTYYVEAINNGCKSARTAVLATINPAPSITKTTGDSRCGEGTVTLTATASSGTINWYAVPTGGNSLASGTSFETPEIKASTTYYADVTNNGCTSARTAVLATINPAPSITKTTGDSRCGEGKVTLTATASSGTINWYAVPTGGNSLASGTSFETPEIKASTTYYVDATFGGCTSDTRTEVIATIDNCPTGLNDATEENTMKVFPNPTQGIVEITFDQLFEEGLIEVFNTQGELLQTLSIANKNKVLLDLTKHPQGTYLIRLSAGSKVYFKKIFKN